MSNRGAMNFVGMVEYLQSQLCPMKARKLANLIEKMENYEEVFANFWDIEEAHRCLSVPEMPPGKSVTEAETLRADGNFLYKERDFEKALEFYNESIRTSPHPKIHIRNSAKACAAEGNAASQLEDSERDVNRYQSLTSGYVNRSALFLMLKEYDRCLADIELALEHGNSNVVKAKLEERKEKCIKAKAKQGNANTGKPISNNAKIPPKITEPNPSVPCYSNAVKVTYSSAKRRHVVATRDIRPGELIAVEKSYCFRTYLVGEINYCSTCLLSCRSLIPCPDCCLVVFCSVACRAKGFEAHEKECKILMKIHALGLQNDSEAILALKVLLQTSFVELKTKIPLLQKEFKELPPRKLGFNESNVYVSTDYRSVYHMASTRHRESSNQCFFSNCIVAFVITKMLVESKTFFVNRAGLAFTPSRADCIMIGGALLHHMCVYPNTFCMSDITVCSPSSNTRKDVVGEALFPALMMIRHACDAPTVHYNFGHVKIVKTVMPIKKGQEVTMSYGDKYQTTPLVYRKLQLGGFGIECSCKACEEDWPAYPRIPDELRLKCVKCRNPVSEKTPSPACHTCDISYYKKECKGEKKLLIRKYWSIHDQVRKAEDKFMLVNRKVDTDQALTKEDFEVVVHFVEIIYEHVHQPCVAFSTARDILLIFFYKDNSFCTNPTV